MAVNEDNPERDPQLARLYQAASGEEPPAALDAAILAAARREVSARPQVLGVAGDGGQASTPPVRAKRNWYVPVSIAAVMVLSVSLVTLVHQEKGDELAQAPTATRPLPKASTQATEPPTASDAKPDAALSDTAPATAKLAEEKRAEFAAAAKAPAAPEAYAELAKKQRTEKREAPADSIVVMQGAARKDQAAGSAAREQGPASEVSAAPQGAAGAVIGGLSAGTRSPAVAAPARERRPEPFPAVTGEREAPAPSASPAPVPVTPPAPAGRDALETRQRGEADRNVVSRSAVQDAPAASAPAPPAKTAAAARRGAPAEDMQTQSVPATKPALRLMEKRSALWRGLEDQPPEKWLERLAEFKRDGRQADADELLAEFRRRFPDHPASAR